MNGQSCRRVEVLAEPERRRQWWSWQEKAQNVAESLAPGAVGECDRGITKSDWQSAGVARCARQ
ncbi:MAG: hypothetical protein P9C55_07545 [Defluviicoccus sp.]|nr:hypothetical protein [Defluviicoccus sp.]